MSLPLAFVFFFMGAIALALSMVIGQLIRAEAGRAGLLRARNRLALGGLVISGLVFVAFRLALPEGSNPLTALMPVLWLLAIVAGIVAGLSLAARGR